MGTSFWRLQVQGRGGAAAEAIQQQALELEQAGIQLIVLEGMPHQLAASISQQLRIPTIGIGAGLEVDGQVLVLHDMLGMNPRPARFVRDFLCTGNSIQNAIEMYIQAVQSGTFPNQQESYSD